MPEYSPAPESPFIPASDFWEGSDEVEWLVDGLLPAASVSMIVGRPKAGKTILSLNLALSVACGTRFLGRRCQPGRVGLIQLEDPDVLILKRLKTMIKLPPAGLFVSTGKPWDAGLRALLPAFIIEHGLTLVVIDPLVLWQPGTKENSAEAMAALLYGLRNSVQDTGCAILIVHHARKAGGDHGEGIRGSTAILGAVDVAIILHKREEGKAHLETKSRFGEVEDKAIELDAESLTWEYRGSVQDARRSEQTSQILDLLEVENGLPATEIQERLGIPPRTLYRVLAYLEEGGVLTCTEGAASEKGGRPPKIYFLGSCQDDSSEAANGGPHGT